MKITAILIDDEFHARAVMKNLLEEHVPQVLVVGEAESAETGIKLIKKFVNDNLRNLKIKFS